MTFEAKYQVLASIIIGGFTGINLGSILGFAGVLLPQLNNETVSTSDKGWIASTVNVGQLTGSLMSGFLSNSIGRNNCLLLFNISLLAGWLTIIFHQESVNIAILGRILQGFGVVPSIGQVYLMEVLDTKRRGIFGSTLAISISIGGFLVYAFDALVHGIQDSWVIVAWIFVGLVIIQCFGLMFIPKSPQWLICKGRLDCAEASLKKYRGRNTDISKELESLKNAANIEDDKQGESNIWKEFLEPEAYKPLGLLILLFALQQLSGVYAVISYSGKIFKGFLTGELGPKLASVSINGVRIVGSVLAVVFLKMKFSNRLQMILSAMSMFVSMVILAVLSQISQQNVTESGSTAAPSTAVSVITVISLSAFLLFHAVGFNVIPFLLMGELCPVNLKSLTSGIVMSFVAILVFGIIKLFPVALDELGGAATYGFFAVFCIGGAVFGFFLIPETRGKSADELSHFYRQRALTINPVDIMSTTMSLPGSRKTSELGNAPMGITGISLAWAGTGQANGMNLPRSRKSSEFSNAPSGSTDINLTQIHINKLQDPPRYDNTRKTSNAHSNQGYVD